MLGSHCLKVWCSTQGATALSSREAEYYAMVEGAVRALGVQGIGKELGVEACGRSLVLGTDSSAAKSLGSRRGAGRIKHMEVRWYWLQEQVRRGGFY